MNKDLSRSLHALTARADRAADRILRAECGISYSRFLTLYAVSELGVTTQRALAEWLGVAERSVSRMVRVLADEGLLAAPADPSGGSRRRLTLTPAGRRLVAGCGQLLEDKFAAVVDAAGVSYDAYRDSTLRLLAALGGTAQAAANAKRESAKREPAKVRAS